jgi:hypothetical protein
MSLCVACMVRSTHANAPVADPDEPALRRIQRATEDALPSQAKRGTGVIGTLGTTALDAVHLSFSLADGRTLHAKRQRLVDDRARELKSWIGTFEDQPGSLVVLGTYRGATTGFLSYGAELWEILPAREYGRVILYRFDDSQLPSAEPSLVPRKAKDAPLPSDYGTGGATAEMLEAGYVHDLLVVYTPASRVRYGRLALESMIQNAVQAANQAYRNSGVAITLNLVGLQEVEYEESKDMKASLRRLEARRDGQLDSVHALRDKVGADVVTLVSEDDDSCGIAWSMKGESPSGASTAFNVVQAGCLSNQSLAHEVGHNQGNMHDRDSTSNVGAFSYSYGYRHCTDDGTGFRTVMAYSCKGVARVARFSSPSLTYNGEPMGIGYEADPENSADNVRSMNNTADTVAAFRTPPGARAASPPQHLSAWTSAPSTVVLHWFDASVLETGYKVERSTNGLDFTEIAMLGSDATNFVDNDAGSASRYYYRVRAYNSRGNSAFTEIRDVGMW